MQKNWVHGDVTLFVGIFCEKNQRYLNYADAKRYTCRKIYIIYLTSIAFQIPDTVVGDGTILVKFKLYDNKKGLAANGHCCDGKWGICQPHGCDHRFSICLDKQGG